MNEFFVGRGLDVALPTFFVLLPSPVLSLSFPASDVITALLRHKPDRLPETASAQCFLASQPTARRDKYPLVVPVDTPNDRKIIAATVITVSGSGWQ